MEASVASSAIKPNTPAVCCSLPDVHSQSSAHKYLLSYSASVSSSRAACRKMNIKNFIMFFLEVQKSLKITLQLAFFNFSQLWYSNVSLSCSRYILCIFNVTSKWCGVTVKKHIILIYLVGKEYVIRSLCKKPSLWFIWHFNIFCEYITIRWTVWCHHFKFCCFRNLCRGCNYNLLRKVMRCLLPLH